MGRKINLSRISPAKRSRYGPNLVYVDKSTGDNVQGIFCSKWGLGRVLRSARFLCNPEALSATSQRPIFTKFGHERYLGVPSMTEIWAVCRPEIGSKSLAFLDAAIHLLHVRGAVCRCNVQSLPDTAYCWQQYNVKVVNPERLFRKFSL